MPGLTIAWKYLTGYAVATDPANRDQPEWPPHPARVFMALAAAWFETGEDSVEGEALRWLERLGSPMVQLPKIEFVAPRAVVTQYVPVNDKAGPSAATLQSAPALTRSKQARSTPMTWVGDRTCRLHWSDAADVDQHSQSLAQLCGKVTRIGHSSSLVQVWIDDDLENRVHEEWLAPSESTLGVTTHLRTVQPGLLDALSQQTQTLRIRQFADFAERIETSKGKPLKEAKAAYEEAFGEKWKQASKPPALGRPNVKLATPYAPIDDSSDTSLEHSYFDPQILILREAEPRGLPSTMAYTVALRLREATMSRCDEPIPAWLSGHEADGSPMKGDEGHTAFVPLTFVGSNYADGSLKGMAIVFPRAWQSQKERGKAIGPLLVNEEGQPKVVALNLGRLGKWRLEKADWSERRNTLQASTWTAVLKGARIWESATPVVLDRFPKADRVKDRIGWMDEVCQIVRSACTRTGLPEPVAVDIGTTSWLKGAPRAIGKRRRLRGHTESEHLDAALGNAYPAYPKKGASASRPQVHLWLQFAEPIVGPVILGAGRFLGYGLCKPVFDNRVRSEVSS